MSDITTRERAVKIRKALNKYDGLPDGETADAYIESQLSEAIAQERKAGHALYEAVHDEINGIAGEKVERARLIRAYEAYDAHLRATEKETK